MLFVSVAYPDVIVCYVVILLYTCITVLKSFMYATGLDYWMLNCLYFTYHQFGGYNQISWLIFAALWTEKQARVVVILAVKDSETNFFLLIIRLPNTIKSG